jgi:dienelactone hydrolase
VPSRLYPLLLALIALPAWAADPALSDTAPPPPFPAEHGSVPADPARRVRMDGAPDATRELLKRFDRLEPGFDWSLATGRPNGWGYQVQHLVFPSPVTSPYASNNTIHGEYYRPDGAGRRPAVIVLDILAGNAVVSTMVADTLARQGVAALMIRMAYYGERRPPETDRRRIESDPPLLLDAMAQTVTDIGRAAAWLRSRPEVDPGRIGLCGTSLGAFAAALAAGVYGGAFPRVLLVMGGGDVADVIWNGRETAKARAKLEAADWTQERLARELVPVDPLTWAARVPRGSVQMINGTRDDVVSPANARKLREALGGAAIQWYDAGHYTMAAYAPAILARAGRLFGEPAWGPIPEAEPEAPGASERR